MRYLIILACTAVALGLIGCKQGSNVAKSSDTEIEDFKTFYTRFLQDSTFQYSRIQFPVDGEIIEEDKSVSDKIERKDWDILIGSVYDVDTNEYTVVIEEGPTAVFHRIYIPDSGVDIVQKYKNIRGKWYLVYYKSIFM